MAEESKTGNGAVVELPKAPNAPMGVAASALQATATTAQPAGRANQDSLLKVSEIVDRVRLDRHTEAASAKRAGAPKLRRGAEGRRSGGSPSCHSRRPTACGTERRPSNHHAFS